MRGTFSESSELHTVNLSALIFQKIKTKAKNIVYNVGFRVLCYKLSMFHWRYVVAIHFVFILYLP